jgi:dTDP-glucose 4,6-dehydratase
MVTGMQTLLVTGGAGFIGSNFVRLALARTAARVVVFDSLTYAGSLESLRDVASDPRFTFVQADITDRAAVAAALAAHRPTAIVNFAAETHVDRSIDGPRAFVTTNVVGTFELLDAAPTPPISTPRRGGVSLPARLDGRGTARSGRPVSSRKTRPMRPTRPMPRPRPRRTTLVRVSRDVRAADAAASCSNNHGPYQFPEKLIPPDPERHEASRCTSAATAAMCATGSTSTTIARAFCAAREGSAGREIQYRW